MDTKIKHVEILPLVKYYMDKLGIAQLFDKYIPKRRIGIPMGKWQVIWNRDERVHKIILESLIKADGFDCGAGSFHVNDWLRYIEELHQTAGLDEASNIFEVGCGSGAFIYPLYLKKIRVGGLDYSKILSDLAGAFMPEGQFFTLEASEMETEDTYDTVMSHSVFHYFRNLEYARDIVQKMLAKANKTVAIFDINDLAKEDVYVQIRRGNMAREEYEAKYAGLEHMFYSKEWFKDLAKEFDLKVDIFDQSFKNYTNSELRFNVVFQK